MKYVVYVEVYLIYFIVEFIRVVYGESINENELVEYNEILGYGIKVKVDGKEVFVGNVKLMVKE